MFTIRYLAGTYFCATLTVIPDAGMFIHVLFVVRRSIEPPSADVAIKAVGSSVDLHVLSQVAVSSVTFLAEGTLELSFCFAVDHTVSSCQGVRLLHCLLTTKLT